MVTLIVVKTLGQHVATFVNQIHETGYHEVKFDGNNLASGVYYYRITVRNFMLSKTLLLIR